MKNFLKLLGIISLAVIIGFSMTACDFGGDDDTNGDNGGGGGGGATSGITIKNNTGYGLIQCHVKPSTTTDWGSNLFPYNYAVSLDNGESLSITLPSNRTNHDRYDFRVSSSAGNFTKYYVSFSRGMTVTFTSSDFDNGNQNPQITIQNRSGVNFNSCKIKPSSGSDWGIDFGSISNNNDRSVTLPFLLSNYNQFDIQMSSSEPANTYTKSNVIVSNGMVLIYTRTDSDNPHPIFTMPVIVIQNNTGYGLIQCHVKPSSSSDWGSNLFPYNYAVSLDNGESRTITLPYSISDNNVYDIRLTSSAGNFIKNNFQTTDGMIVTFTITDFQ